MNSSTPASRLVAILLALATISVSACASSAPLTEDEQTDAIRACFEKHENYPSARMACINRARTADVETEAGEPTE